MKQHRINDPDSVDPSEIKRLIKEGHRVIIQFSRPGYRISLIEELNQLAGLHGRSVEIRFYGHHAEDFDASILRSIPAAACVSVDCLSRASNLDAMGALVNLKELRLGVFELDARDVLSFVPKGGLESLALGDTRKSNIDLSHLRDCQALRRFHTTGQVKNIDSLAVLPELSSLSLSSIKKKHALAFVSEIPGLRSLRICLGGRSSIADISVPRLTKLEIIRVRGLEDLGDLGRFAMLQELLVEDQIRLGQIDLGRNLHLRDIKILNCKTLEGISGIKSLSALEQIRIYQTAVDYEKFISKKMPESLEILAFYTGKKKLDVQIQGDLASRGYREF